MSGTGHKDRAESAPEAAAPGETETPEVHAAASESAEAEVRPEAPEAEGVAQGEPAPDGAEPEARGSAVSEGAAPKKAAPKKAAPSKEETHKETEIESLLGPNVRTPVGIPKDYRPLDSSLTEIFHVELDDFAGPMDLLVYLIRKHELDIFDIPIKFIADRYMEMLEVLKALEIDTAAEFLVLAADLVHIKSKMLLPAKEGLAVDDDPEEEDDPREELVRRLLEYQKYRDAAEQLGDRDQLGRDVFARVPPNVDTADDLDPGLKGISIFKLVEVMAKMMRRTPKVSHSIELETFSIAERIHYVVGFGQARDGRFTLVQLLEGMRSRQELVVTFIAVLECTKLQLAKILVDESHPADHPMMPPHDHYVEDWQDGLQPAEAPDADEVEHALHPEFDEDEPDEDASEEGEAPAADAAPTEADGALEETRRLARELEALEASMEVEAEEERARDEARAAALAADTAPWDEEPLPTIWVVLTGRAFEGDILDDYA